MIFKVLWRRKMFPKATPNCGFVNAVDKDDAQRIMKGNLSSDYEIVDAIEADPILVTPESITLNFRYKDLFRFKTK